MIFRFLLHIAKEDILQQIIVLSFLKVLKVLRPLLPSGYLRQKSTRSGNISNRDIFSYNFTCPSQKPSEHVENDSSLRIRLLILRGRLRRQN
jgi:hypothetical protein